MTELFARSQIDIYLQILQFDGGKSRNTNRYVNYDFEFRSK
jgi:hypothetical protein